MNAIGDVVFNENVKTTFYYKVESQSDAKIPLPLYVFHTIEESYTRWNNYDSINGTSYRIRQNTNNHFTIKK